MRAARLGDLWLRGGFPPSVRAPSDGRSQRWRESFIRTYLERDVPQFGPRIAAETLRRFWTMLAHHQGGLLNMTQLARNRLRGARRHRPLLPQQCRRRGGLAARLAGRRGLGHRGQA